MTRASKAKPEKPARPRKTKPAPYAVPPGHVLALRVCAAGGISHRGFRWPTEAGGIVEPVRWDPAPTCGDGLHGWLWGAGDIRAASDAVYLSPDSLWYVLEIAAADLVEVTESGGGKIKCRRCRVVFVGARDEAVKLIAAHAPPGTVALFGTATAGYRGTATAGYRGTATAGEGGTATAGEGGTATAGYSGTATAGDSGTATAGDSGTATAGYSGTATAGYRGTATAGYRGTATAGYRGTATAGEGGSISIRWWDGDALRWRLRSGDVGAKEKLKPGVKYRLNDRGEFEEAK